jgi:hypothetical protein
MNKKLIFSFVLAIFLVLTMGSFSSAVCCEKLKNSPSTCMDAESLDECNPSFLSSQLSCTNYDPCNEVTCIYENSGECSPNIPEITCTRDGGTPDSNPPEEIDVCQTGCTIFLDGSVYPGTRIQGQQISMANGIEVREFHLGMSEEECKDRAEPQEIVACVFEGDYLKDCEMITKGDCVARGGEDHVGKLCTAPGLSDCAKTSNTICSEDKVYFLDGCENKANVYDAEMFSNSETGWGEEMTDYWTYPQDPVCSISEDGSRSCGDCDRLQGTTCEEYNRFEMPPEENPIFGENTCTLVKCDDSSDINVQRFMKKNNGRSPQQGESWCAEGEGINSGIGVYASNGFITDTERERLEKGYNQFNLPGSEYAFLTCWDGEIEPEPCDSMRRQVCKETLIGDEDNFYVARCFANNWLSCMEIGNKDNCEVPELDCKWVYGFRLDGLPVSEETRDINQGSCVPLIAPGFMFWDDTTDQDGKEWCEFTGQTVEVLYETHWSERRDNFEKFDLDVSDGKSVHQDCLENCYAIPQYGDDVGKDIIENSLWKGNTVRNLQDIAISLRRGHYCEKKNDPTKKKIGAVTGESISCAANEEKRRDLPVFFTNADWLSFLTERTRSIGDCGYKAAPNGIYNSPRSEVVTAIFQKLTQQLGVKENVTVEAIIYEADENPENGLKLLTENYYRSGGNLTSSGIYTNHLDRAITDGFPGGGSSEEGEGAEGDGNGFPGVGQ